MSSPSSDDVYRHPLEKIATDYLEGLREGQGPSIDDLAAQNPEDAREVRELLQLVSAMETWKLRRELSTMRQTMPEQFRFERLGDCRLIREIGRGGMGVVFEAQQESMNRRVAVKLLPWRFPKSSPLRERFQYEAHLAGKLRHKHIVPVYHFGEQDGWCYYVMHLVPGIGLDRVIRKLGSRPYRIHASEILSSFQQPAPRTGSDGRRGQHRDGSQRSWWQALWPFSWSATPDEPTGWTIKRENWTQIARFGLQVADGLRYAHEAGILHRDIKPGNLILDERKRLWIADFGLAQIDHREEQSNSDNDNIAGTLRYIAPEQLAGFPDARSDLYSLGITLYELCVLKPAFTELDRNGLTRAVRDVTPPSPQQLNSRCPPELSRIVMQSIAKNPDERFQSAGELMAALSNFLEQQRPAGRNAAKE